MDEATDLDWQVRRHIYDVAMQSGKLPLIADISAELNVSIETTQAALGRLAAGRALVLQPETGEILMANPFSAVPTPFLVQAPDFSCYANCIWDALGIPAMLHQNAQIKTTCGDCGLALELKVVNDRVQGNPSVVHFAVPAHHWWDDIVFN